MPARLMLLLIAGLSVAGCVNREFMKELEAKHKARIEAARIPDVELSEEQIAKLKALAPQANIAWLRAGRQADGKIFVCHVTSGKTLFGQPTTGLITGTFETDGGAYQRSPAFLWSLQAVLQDCHEHGYEPPVTINTTYSTIRIR